MFGGDFGPFMQDSGPRLLDCGTTDRPRSRTTQPFSEQPQSASHFPNAGLGLRNRRHRREYKQNRSGNVQAIDLLGWRRDLFFQIVTIHRSHRVRIWIRPDVRAGTSR